MSLASVTLRLKYEQIGHRSMPLLILKPVKLLAIYLIAIRFVWFEFHLHHASLLVGFVSRLADRLGN